MNGIAASVLLNITAGVRFEGSLNVDLNEITMNMVPYPKMQFLMSSISPMVRPGDAKERNMQELGSDHIYREHGDDLHILVIDNYIHGRVLRVGKRS